MYLNKLFILILLSMVSLHAFSAGHSPLQIPSRELPLPDHASESVRDALKNLPPRDLDEIRNTRMPQDSGEWKAFIADFDKAGVAQGKELAESLGVNYERTTINGSEVFLVTPSEAAPAYRNNLFVHIHGGAWIYGGEESALREAVRISHHLGISVVSVNYRKAPDYPAPAALNDIVAVWSHLITERPADSMMMGGSSAGGNLTTVSAMRIRDLGLPLPGALFIGTPAADLYKPTDSRFIMEGIDAGLGTWDNMIEASAQLYYGDNDPRDPYISPVYGDFYGFPPAMLVSGTRDLLLSDTVLLHRAIRAAGGEADLHIYESHSHGFYGIPGDDMDDFFGELDAFAGKHLKTYRRFRKRDLAPSSHLSQILIPEDIPGSL